MNKRVRYTCSGYKYAPESFEAFRVYVLSNNPSYEKIPLSQEQTHKIGMLCIQCGKSEVEKELKRIVRTVNKRQRQKITYGFKLLGDERRFIYDGYNSTWADAGIKARLQVYKQIKHYLLERECKVTYGQSARLDGHYKPQEVEDMCYEANINKPVIVTLIPKAA